MTESGAGPEIEDCIEEFCSNFLVCLASTSSTSLQQRTYLGIFTREAEKFFSEAFAPCLNGSACVEVPYDKCMLKGSVLLGSSGLASRSSTPEMWSIISQKPSMTRLNAPGLKSSCRRGFNDELAQQQGHCSAREPCIHGASNTRSLTTACAALVIDGLPDADEPLLIAAHRLRTLPKLES